MKTKPRLWTSNGLQELGKLIKASREELGRSLGRSRLSQRDLADYIEQKTGYRISDSSLSGLERANREPNYNTLAIVAAAEFVCKDDGTPYSVEELSAIASETFFSQSCQVAEGDNSPILVGKNQERKTVYQFEYLVFVRLKSLMEASRMQLGLSEIQYIRQAASNGITLEEASLFYEDVIDGTYARSHPLTRIEAFLPLLFRLENPRSGEISLNTSRTYAGDFEGLISDLGRLGNGSTVQPVHH